MLSVRYTPRSAMASEQDTRGAAPPDGWPSNVVPLKAAWLYRDEVAPAGPPTTTIPGPPPPVAERTTASLWDGSVIAQRAVEASDAIFSPASPTSHSVRR